MRITTLFVTTASLALVSCMTPTADPAISQSQAQQAAQQHGAVVAEFGGALTGSRAAYVERIGDSVAVHSGTPNAAAAYTFTALNSAVENAFAVPGGRVYITRQLMGIMNDEAELAFVTGHEVGHIAADHSEARQARAQRNSILGVLGAIAGSVIGGDTGLGNLLAQGAQQYATLNTLSYSREQEYEADTLGVRYMSVAGYDPLAGASMLAALARSTALEARIQGRDSRQTPEWARTHPLSENRTAQAEQLARQYPNAGTGMRNRDAFLTQIDGIIVDDDPAQGIIEGTTFTHPDLRLQFSVPTGFLMQNSATQVGIQGSSGQAIFSLAQFNGNLDQYVMSVIQQIVGQKAQVSAPQPRRTTINGLPAAFTTARVTTSSGAVDLSVMAYQFSNDRAYHFAMLTQAGVGIGPFGTMVDSLRRISDSEAAAVRPRIIDIVTVQRGDTLQGLANRMAYRDYKLDRFLALNGLNSNATLQAGQKVKLVVYGTR